MENQNFQRPKPIERDFRYIRKVRQENNNMAVQNSIDDEKLFNKNTNEEEVKRTLKDLGFSKKKLMEKCREDNDFCIVVSRLISKNATKQSTKDEIEQFRTCNITAEKCGINIRNMTPTELRPTKDGAIVSKNEMKIKKIQKDNCLKSFDGKISGKIDGFIVSKVSYGSGGHQDNVFEEQDRFAEWWSTYKCETEEILIVLIDTDLNKKFERLKEKYNDINNVLVFNHIEFQQFMIDNYFEESK